MPNPAGAPMACRSRSRSQSCRRRHPWQRARRDLRAPPALAMGEQPVRTRPSARRRGEGRRRRAGCWSSAAGQTPRLHGRRMRRQAPSPAGPLASEAGPRRSRTAQGRVGLTSQWVGRPAATPAASSAGGPSQAVPAQRARPPATEQPASARPCPGYAGSLAVAMRPAVEKRPAEESRLRLPASPVWVLPCREYGAGPVSTARVLPSLRVLLRRAG